jgi:Fe-S oxidoreductase
MLEKNSSRGTAASEPDHLGTKEIKSRSLWKVGIPMETRSLSRCNSALFSTCSACRRASAVLKKTVSVMQKISKFPALALVTMP